jgi:hypothetical protein
MINFNPLNLLTILINRYKFNDFLKSMIWVNDKSILKVEDQVTIVHMFEPIEDHFLVIIIFIEGL